MKKIIETDTPLTEKAALSTAELRKFLSCGRDTATAIGTKAGAKIRVGRRVLWNTEKVKKYLECISE